MSTSRRRQVADAFVHELIGCERSGSAETCRQLVDERSPTNLFRNRLASMELILMNQFVFILINELI